MHTCLCFPTPYINHTSQPHTLVNFSGAPMSRRGDIMQQSVRCGFMAGALSDIPSLEVTHTSISWV